MGLRRLRGKESRSIPLMNTTTPNVDLLVLSAFSPEYASFALEWQALTTRGRKTSPLVRVEWEAVGIGILQAAINATRILASRKPARVVFLGTCGAFRGIRLAVGDVVVGTDVRMGDSAVVRGQAEWVGEVGDVRRMDDAGVGDLMASGAKPARIVTTLAITTDDALAETLADHLGADVEHLEASAVVASAASFGIPCAVLLGVANEVGGEGRDQWRQNHVRASAEAGRVLLNSLAK